MMVVVMVVMLMPVPTFPIASTIPVPAPISAAAPVASPISTASTVRMQELA